MHSYYKAYRLSDLRQYHGWPDDTLTSQEAVFNGGGSGEDQVVFLREDYAVISNPFAEDEEPLFSSSSAQWQRFCRDVLGFVAHESDLNGN